MGYIEYIELLLSEPWLYLGALLIAFPIYAYVLRKQIASVFDPLFLNMLFAAIGAATVIFLFFTGNIDARISLQYLLSESCYLFCLTAIPLRLGKISLHDEPLHSEFSRRRLQCIYLIASSVFLVSQSFMYIHNGLPIFYDSRLDYYAGGSGLGMISRFIDISAYLCWYLLLYRYTYRWRGGLASKLFDAFLVTCLVAASVLNGSKSGLLIVIFLIFYFRALHKVTPLYTASADRSLRRIQRLTLVLACCAALGVILVSGFAADLVGSLSALAVRIASAGDVYFMAYPGSGLSNLDGSHPWMDLFGPTLAMGRLVDQSSLPVPLGFQIFQNAVHSAAHLGPNPRHNVYGFVYFGYIGSLAYSSMLGLLVCFVRNVLFRYVRLGGISELAYVYVALQVIYVNTDVQAFIGALEALAIVVPLVLVAAYIIDVGTAFTTDDRRSPHYMTRS